MAKEDGKIIVIEFDLPIVGELSGNIDKFTVTVPTLPYGYKNNSVNEACPVIRVEHYTSQPTNIQLHAGTFDLTSYMNGELRLSPMRSTIVSSIPLETSIFIGTQFKRGKLMLMEAE